MRRTNMAQDLRKRLAVKKGKLDELNRFLTDPGNRVVSDFLDVVAKYGTPEEINAKARKAGKLEHQLGHLREIDHPYLKDLAFLAEARDKGAFVTMADYRRRVLGDRASTVKFPRKNAVTLEVSAMQYFPWLRAEAEQAIERHELMPSRFIRVRNMKEQLEDGDIYAMGAAMNIFGASFVETLDTRGTDGSNCHLGGPETITGYFGGVGQPNDHVVRWLDEYLYYHTNYGVRQVLNVNGGTILGAYMLHKLGVDMEFKISVYMGNDNPYAVMWTLMTAKLFCRDDGTTPLIGFNFSNSVNNETIELSSQARRSLSFEELVRFEHHILETYKSIVIQPYDRRAELLEIASSVPNISAKHEGGEVEIESKLAHPSDILDYFMPRKDVEEKGLMEAMERNYLEKHRAVNNTAKALTEKGLSVIAAPKLHHR